MKRAIPDQVILGILKAKPSHGYELLAVFRSKAQLGRSWTLSTSQLYAVLNRLSKLGAIEGKEILSKNAPPRIEYKITAIGEAQLFSWLFETEPSPSINRIRVMFLSRIFIANLLNINPEKIVAAQIKACETQYKKFYQQLHKSTSEIERLIITYVLSQLGSAINWLQNSKFSFTNKLN